MIMYLNDRNNNPRSLKDNNFLIIMYRNTLLSREARKVTILQ